MGSKLALAVALIHFICAFLLQAVATEHNVGIIGGSNIQIEDAPYMAVMKYVGESYYCGGTIIHEKFILTAAHCIAPFQKYQVQVGSSRRNEGGEIYDVEKAIPHELYDSETYDYDIGLLKLAKNLTFSDKVSKIILDDGNITIDAFDMLNVTGWGQTTLYDNGSMDLLQTQVPFVPNSICRLIYIINKITDRMMCAGMPGKDSCQGDSGGPLTLNGVQVGVTSFGYSCGIVPGFYTKVSALSSWIADTIALNL